MRYTNKYVDKDFFIKSFELMEMIRKHETEGTNAFNYVDNGINIKPHEIRHLSKINFLKPLAEWLKERQRETLMISLFAKAVCMVRGKVTIKCPYAVVREESKIRGHYMKSGHMKEFRRAFVESLPNHYALRNEMGLARHWIEETESVDDIIKQYCELLDEQFSRTVRTVESEQHLRIIVNPRFRIRKCAECGRDDCEYCKGMDNKTVYCCSHGDMPDAINEYCIPCRTDYYADLTDAAVDEQKSK